MKLNIAIIQVQPELADPRTNTTKVRKFLGDVSPVGLIVLPELVNSGYNFQSMDEAMASSEVLGEGEYSTMIIREAREKKTYIVSGLNERVGDKLYNTAFLAGPEGLIGKYRKIHLFVDEKDFFEPGDLGLPVFELNGFKMGILICFDYLFAEAWRIMAEKGADLICHPSNLITDNAFRTVPGQALMNRIFIVTANRIGTEGDLTFCGKSMMTAPDGSCLAMASREDECITYCEADLDLAREKMVTRRNHVFEDRRPEQYF